MARSGCCGGGCSCVIIEGAHVDVTGSGGPSDPFIISADLNLEVLDNTTFNLTLVGDGSVAAPYQLQVAFASTATVRAFPDWSDTAATNGQVPIWNNGLQQWVPGAQTTAAAGTVSHNVSLSGDGSVGSPLAVVHDANRLTATSATGVGLTDAGLNQTVRKYANSAARTAAMATIAPNLNTLSMLDTTGILEQWNGTAWVPFEAADLPLVLGPALIELSGPYAGTPVTEIIKIGTVTTDALGTFVVLDSVDLTGVSGVLSATITPVTPTPYVAMVSGDVPGQVTGVAYAPSSGEVYSGVSLTYQVVAKVY